jgi:hypothetical protein
MAFHLQTDGETEQMNAIMDQYLRPLVNYQQNNWTSWLPMAEFASNNPISETMRYSPFFDNYGFHLRMTISQHPVQNGSDIKEMTENTLSQKMKESFTQMNTEMS